MVRAHFRQSLISRAPIFLLLAVSIVTTSSGQTALDLTSRVRIDVVRVPLSVSVNDQSGRFVTNLSLANFALYDSGQAQRITNVDLETGLPLSIAFVIDDSGSMAGKKGLDVLIKDLAQRVATPSDRLLLTTLVDSRVDLHLDFVGDVPSVMEKLNNLTRSGGTKLYDGIHSGIESWLKREDDSKRRRVILLVSDGHDSQSLLREADVIATGTKYGIAIYAVSTNQISSTGKVTERNGDNLLTSLTNNTGGRAYFPREAKLSRDLLQMIDDELRSRYLIYYEPASARAKPTHLEIRVPVDGPQYSTRIRELRFFNHGQEQ